MSSSIKSFFFALVMCLIVSVVLTAAATSLKERQDLNVANDMKKNILKSMGLLEDNHSYSGEEVSQVYADNISDKFLTESGELSDVETEDSLPIYVNYDGDKIVSYALPTSGYGLWSTIYGFIALKGDGETVAGYSVYKHGETPGLGGEVEKDWFQDQFIGKKIVDQSGEFVSVGVVKGKAKDTVSDEKLPNYVDGISGATITSKGVDSFLRKDLKEYEVLSSRLRGE